jgi:hypothetical protein
VRGLNSFLLLQFGSPLFLTRLNKFSSRPHIIFDIPPPYHLGPCYAYTPPAAAAAAAAASASAADAAAAAAALILLLLMMLLLPLTVRLLMLLCCCCRAPSPAPRTHESLVVPSPRTTRRLTPFFLGGNSLTYRYLTSPLPCHLGVAHVYLAAATGPFSCPSLRYFANPSAPIPRTPAVCYRPVVKLTYHLTCSLGTSRL